MKKLIAYTGIVVAFLLANNNFAQAQDHKISDQGRGAAYRGRQPPRVAAGHAADDTEAAPPLVREFQEPGTGRKIDRSCRSAQRWNTMC